MQINKLSSNIATWSAHYNAILGEQQPSASLVPDRMPNLESIDDMIRTQDALSNALQEMRGVIFEQAQNTAQQRMHMMRPPGEYDEDVMFGDEMKGHAYGSESKKRRGVGSTPVLPHPGELTMHSEPRPPEDVTVAIAPRRPSGDEARTARERSATRADCTTRN